MALQLKRITWPYDTIKCDLTKQLIVYGQYYYEDDEDGLVVDAEYYHQRKMAAKMEEAMLNPELNIGADVMGYRTAMREAERRYLDNGLLERPIAGKPYAPKGGM